MTYLLFVTLNTGERDRVRTPGPDLAEPEALDLARALREGRAAIAARPGYEIKALTRGHHLLCTIYLGRDIPLATFGVARRSLGADRLWRLLHETSAAYGLATSGDDMPPVPWCAVRVEPGLAFDHADAWRWLADYELGVAWAWIARRK